MTPTEKLWLNGFATMGGVLANDPLAIEEVRQVFDEDASSNGSWLAPWRAGLEAGIRACFGAEEAGGVVVRRNNSWAPYGKEAVSASRD